MASDNVDVTRHNESQKKTISPPRRFESVFFFRFKTINISLSSPKKNRFNLRIFSARRSSRRRIWSNLEQFYIGLRDYFNNLWLGLRPFPGGPPLSTLFPSLPSSRVCRQNLKKERQNCRFEHFFYPHGHPMQEKFLVTRFNFAYLEFFCFYFEFKEIEIHIHRKITQCQRS